MAEDVKKTSGRPKKAVEDKVEDIVVVDKEKEELKAKNDEMAEMLKQMQEQMKTMQTQMNMQNQSQPNIVLEQNKDITRTVKVTSLVGNVLTLSTTKNGTKPCHTTRFDKYGQTKSILFTQMQQILSYHISQFEDGKVILNSQQDYNDLGIGYIYDSIMEKDKIDELILLKDENAIDTILEMNESMQEKIIDLIAQKLASGESYDYNKIKELKDEGFDVEAIAEQIKNVPKKDNEEE